MSEKKGLFGWLSFGEKKTQRTGEYRILIDGKWVTTEKELRVTSPFDSSHVGTTYLASGDELKMAVASAHASFETLKSMTAYERSEILERVVEGLKNREEEIAQVIAREAGKPIRDARLEVSRAQGTFKIAAEESKRLYGEVIPLDVIPGVSGREGITKHFPIGLVLGITPFNFPLNLVAHKVAPAMAVGNPIIIKPASSTPITSILLGEVITDAGWPAGGVSIVPCSGRDAEAVLDDDRIKKLSFTGSPAVGWHLKGVCKKKRVTLELGGNAGVIVHSDADVERAAERCLLGAFSYAGQICISVQRIYVHSDIFDAFKERFLEKVSGLKVGDPTLEGTDVGPMIDGDSVEQTKRWIAEAEKGGAKVIAGGNRSGNTLEPTVLTGTVPSMKVCSEELFAPVVVLERYDDFKGAVGEVNLGHFGLQAGVFTKDSDLIFSAYRDLDVGGLIVDDIPTFRVDSMPYGGVKDSGFGREGVRYAMEDMMELKLLVLNHSK